MAHPPWFCIFLLGKMGQVLQRFHIFFLNEKRKAWRQPGDKSLSEVLMTKFIIHGLDGFKQAFCRHRGYTIYLFKTWWYGLILSKTYIFISMHDDTQWFLSGNFSLTPCVILSANNLAADVRILIHSLILTRRSVHISSTVLSKYLIYLLFLNIYCKILYRLD